MGQRIFSFLVVFLLMFSSGLVAQDSLVIKAKTSYTGYGIQPRSFRTKFSGFMSANSGLVANQQPVSFRAPLQASYYPNSLGVICRTELKLDKISPVPIRLRLGSLEYVNRMEGKIR